jgi:hypothetical protein
MDNDTLTVTGAFTGSDSTITAQMLTPAERQKLLDDANANSGIYVICDLSITTSRGVEFLWPNERYPILRANAQTGDHLRIRSNTLTGKFNLDGKIKILGGEIFYFQRSFYIKSGSLTFNENEVKFEPRLSAVAQTKEQSQEGPVTLSIVVNDQSLNSFQPLLQSNPPLSQAEIFSILGTSLAGQAEKAPSEPSEGKTEGSEDTDDREVSTDNERIARPFVAAAGDVLAQFQVVRRVERSVRDLLHVDIFSARTQALQNALFQAAFADPNESDPRLASYFDNTTLLIGKYLTPNLFVQSMFTTDYDKNKLTNGGMNFDLSFGVELTTPLLDISADITPIRSGQRRHADAESQGFWATNTAGGSITLSKSWRLP